MKNILCFGDSNTWGYMPGIKTRYAADVRWPGVMKSLLGPEYNVYEEAISGRLTVFDDPFHNYWNGRNALGYALLANYPLDLVILMLGTNDLKYVSVEKAAKGISVLIEDIRNASVKCESFTPIFETEPKILVVSPPTLHPEILTLNPTSDLKDGYEESAKFAEEFRKVAEAAGVAFLDAASYAKASEIDGIHLAPEEHEKLGLAIAEAVKALLG